jgi:hypothetical protein
MDLIQYSSVLCVFVCVCVCLCVYVNMCVYVCACLCVHVYMFVCMCVHVCVCVYVCMCVYMCMCVCLCVCTYVYVCACVYCVFISLFKFITWLDNNQHSLDTDLLLQHEVTTCQSFRITKDSLFFLLTRLTHFCFYVLFFGCLDL